MNVHNKSIPGMKFVVCHLLAVSMRDEDKLLEGLRKLALPNVWFDLGGPAPQLRAGRLPLPQCGAVPEAWD